MSHQGYVADGPVPYHPELRLGPAALGHHFSLSSASTLYFPPLPAYIRFLRPVSMIKHHSADRWLTSVEITSDLWRFGLIEKRCDMNRRGAHRDD